MSRDVFSKTREKRSRSSSGESNNSFVKNVTARVSGYLPATITKWFSSPRSTSNGSAPAAEATDSSTEDEAPESPVTAQPPAKRMRFTSGTETNCITSNIEAIESYTVQSPPGRTTFRRETNFVSTPIRSPDETTMDRTEKDTTTFSQHTVSVTGPTVSQKRNSLFGNQSQEISEASKKACVKTSNNTVKDPRQPSFKPTLLGSPFYAGRTTYGGAASSYVNQPNISQRQSATVRESTSNADNNISHSARRVLELLESYSSPLAEAKRIPQYSRPTKEELRRRISESALSSRYTKPNSYKTQELHVPRIATILRLRQRSRLDDTTNAARQLIASHSSSTPDYHAYPYGTKSDQTETDSSSKITTKVKSRLTRPTRGESHTLDTDTVTPPDLPNAVLQIDSNNLPKFSLPAAKTPTRSVDKPVNKNETVLTKPLDTRSKHETSLSNSIYNFASPVRITSESPKTTSTPPTFTFGSPERSIETASTKGSETPKPLVPKETQKPATASANWQCPDCWVNNTQDADKCVCCGYKQAPKSSNKVKCSLCKLADSQADSDRCVNCAKVQPNNIGNPLKADTSKWKCKDCWVDNDEAADKCVCCGAKNPKATSQTVNAKKPDTGGTCSKCFGLLILGKCTKCTESVTKPNSTLKAIIKSQAEKWECKHCLVQNDSNRSKCICCEGERAHQTIQPETHKFNFGTGAASFKFGIDPKVQEANLAKAEATIAETKDKVEESETNNNVLSKAPPTFSFSIPAKKTEDQTEAPNGKKEEIPKVTFSFGIPSQKLEAAAPAPTPASAPAPAPASALASASIFGIPNKVNDTPKTNAEVQDKPREATKPEDGMKPQAVIFGATSTPTSAPTPSQSTAGTTFSLEKKDAPSNPLGLPTTSVAAAPTLSFSAPKPDATSLFVPSTSISFTQITTTVSSAGIFQKTDDTSKPLSIFQKSETAAPAPASASLFQKSEAPAATPSAAHAAAAPAAAAPMFSFGSASPAQPQADKPKFNFTFGANKTDNVFKPTFGAPIENNTNKFTLGSAATENPLAAVNPLASSGTNLSGNTLAGNSLPVNSLGATNALPTSNNLSGGGLAPAAGLFGSSVQKENMWSTPNSAPNLFNASATSNSLTKPFSFGATTGFNSTAPSFGATTSQASTTPAFGGAAPSAFGGSSQAAAAPAFGAAVQPTPTPTPNIFGMANQNSQPSMFSSPNQSAPMFGAAQPAPALGVFARAGAVTASPFGAPGASMPAFEAPAPAPTAPAFNFTSQPTGVFGFGQQQQQSGLGGAQTGVYSFGGAGAAPGPVQFNMGASPPVRRVRKATRRTLPR